MRNSSPIWTKGLIGLLFCLVGLFCAESIAGSAAGAPLLPPFYAIYGIIDLLLLDHLIRRRVSSWLTVYTAGMIVGYLTESFAAKVMWFGWPDSHLNPFGIFPIPEFPFLIFFYHPIFSFCIPVYLARKYLAFPLALPTSRWADRALLLWPLFPAMNLAAMPRGPAFQMERVGLDFVIFLILTTVLARSKAVVDILYRRSTRVLLGILLLATYVFAFFKMPPFGRSTVILPNSLQIAFATTVLLLLAWMFLRQSHSVDESASFAFDPTAIDLKSVTGWTAYVVATMAAGIGMAIMVPAVTKIISVTVFLLGMLIGTSLFLSVILKNVRGMHCQSTSEIFFN